MRTILITGVSRGLGAGLAHAFLKYGDRVLGTSTSGTAPYEHPNLQMFQLNLAKPESIQNCVSEIQKTYGSINILINNAGICVEEEVKEPTIVLDYLRTTLEVNLIGIIDFTERIIPLMQDDGQIVNISSRAGSLSFTEYTLNYPTYRISKTALNMATKIWAERLKDRIRVSAVHPGWVQTDMGGEEADLTPEEAAQYILELTNSTIPSGKFWFKGEEFPW